VSESEKADARLVRTVRIGRLLDIYGPLLTERQREFVRLHHDEDMSFGEIARQFGISRQAVHDAVRQAEAAMERYESGLHLISRLEGDSSAASVEPQESAAQAPAADLRPIIESLERIRRKLATQGIIYDPERYAGALGEVIEKLQELAGGR